jgi:BirA family biotin operon repressor/biotin-[acetyl-CoA-carboxylase] ligase
MKHIHLDSCESTQKYLIEMIKENKIIDEGILVSCNTQTAGIGQKQNTWDSYEHSICLSGVIKPNQVLTLTPLEVGVIVCSYFKREFDVELKLKWPNDILNLKGEKVGGVIINKSGEGPLIVGLGINLMSSNKDTIQSYDYKVGYIFEEEKNLLSKKDIALDLYKAISNLRLNPDETRETWNSFCIHLDKNVTVKDNSNNYKGLFIGIGENGQALIKDEDRTHELYSGTLRI